MIVAVSGATGFLGREITSALEREGSEVRILSRSAPAANAHVVSGDLLDRDACRRLVDGVDVVVHTAGLVRSADASALLAVNREGTRLLAAATAAAGVSRFVHVSSTGVYGLPGARVDEESALRPGNAYERSKAAAELDLRRWGEALSVVVVRPSNIVGPGRRGRPLLRLMRRIRDGRVWVDGEARANYVDVVSVGEAVRVLACAPDPPSSVILNQGQSLPDFLSMVAASLGTSAAIRRIPGPIGHIARPVFAALSPHVPAVGRARALFDRTDFTTVNGEWLHSAGWRPDLLRALAAMAAGYRADGLL